MDSLLLAGETLPAEHLQAMSTEELRGELARSLQLNASQLLHLAAVWRELERRGEDLSDLRSGMGAYLPMIAAGRLDANAVVKFAGQTTILRALIDLPIERQRAIIADTPIDVVVLDAAGESQIKALPAYTLTAAQVRQVFAPGRLRDTKEQEAVLLQTVTRKRKARAIAGTGQRVRYDASADTLVVGRQRVAVGDVLGALVVAGDDDGAESDDAKTVPVRLSEAQHRQLKIRAAESGTSQVALVKMAMRRAGLI
jgi:hypothetical protein